MSQTICQNLPNEISSDLISDRLIIIVMHTPLWLAVKKFFFPKYAMRFLFLKNSNGLKQTMRVFNILEHVPHLVETVVCAECINPIQTAQEGPLFARVNGTAFGTCLTI